MTLLHTIIAEPWLVACTDAILFAVRLTAGGIMMYFGYGKLKDPMANAKDFDENIAKPGWLFGNLVLITEFLGGLALVLGILTNLAAVAIAFEMLVGTLTKIFKWKKDFGDWSYDVLVFALCLVLLVFGTGAYALMPTIIG